MVSAQPRSRPEVIDALRGVAHALHTIASVSLMVDPRDLGHTLGDKKDAESAPSKGAAGPGFDPTLFLYDRMPGGVGLAPRLFEQREELLLRTRRLIEQCACDDGCPCCVGPVIGMPDPALPKGSRRGVALGVLRDLGVATAH